MDDPLALAERRLAAGELRPALDALKEARVRAYEAGDRGRLERIGELALELRPRLGGGRADRSCSVLLLAVNESLQHLSEHAGEEHAGGTEPEVPPPTLTRPVRDSAPVEDVAKARPEPAEPSAPAAAPVAEPRAAPEVREPEPEPHMGHSVRAADIVEAEEAILEPGERLLGAFRGVVREAREDGSRGSVRGGSALHDYLLVTDRGVVLWARGKGGNVEGLRFAEVTGVEAVRGVLARSLWLDAGDTRRWFASMRRDDAETAAGLIRELAGLAP